MKLGGDSKSIYRKIIGLIGLERAKELKIHNTPLDILKTQEWIKSYPFCDKKLEKVNVKVRAEPRTIYFERKELEKFGFFVKTGNVNGIKVGNAFVKLSEREEELLIEALKSDNELVIYSIVCPESLVSSFFKALPSIKKLISYLSECGIEARNSKKIVKLVERTKSSFERVEKAKMVEEIVVEELLKLNERIERKISELEVVLRGKRIIEVLQGSTLEEVEEVVFEEVVKSEKEVGEKLEVEVSELFSRTYPVEVDERKLGMLKEEVEGNAKVELFKECRDVAMKIVESYEGFVKELDLAKNIELTSTLKKLGETFPEIAEYTAFLEGKHLFIKDPQPITYSIGDSNIAKGRIAILTGANSGGKTSLLELLTQIQIMGQMGLPVKAKKAWINVFDGIYFFRKKRGVAGAGAFESAVKSFVKAVSSNGKNLILVDEFEAITEPGAAVSILAELLKIAYERGHYVVIVSHLGRELKELLPFARVDGIEAKGLDDEFNLIVDRQPVFGKLGRSTPELILERIYRKAKSELEKRIVKRILDNMNY